MNRRGSNEPEGDERPGAQRLDASRYRIYWNTFAFAESFVDVEAITRADPDEDQWRDVERLDEQIVYPAVDLWQELPPNQDAQLEIFDLDRRLGSVPYVPNQLYYGSYSRGCWSEIVRRHMRDCPVSPRVLP